MTQFHFTYHGGRKPETPEEGQQAMQKWTSWAETLGAALINPGTPVGLTHVLTADGVSSDPSPHPIKGFSIIEADDLDAAIDLLKNCPHFEFGGTLEISEMMQMPG